MSELIHRIYASAATQGFAAPELARLLQQARDGNDRLGVTGILLFAEGSFFQVLEGSRDSVDALYARIARDTRHDQVTTIICEPIHRRSFGSWTMGFSSLSRADVADAAGMNDFFGAGSCFADLDGGRAKKLLAAFREGRWRKTLAGA